MRKQKLTAMCLSCIFCLWLPFAHAASAIVLLCRRRPPVTLAQTNYGLMTEQWGSNFEVSQGYENARLPDGEPVRLYRFRNGDQLFQDMKNGRYFFSYAGQDVLEPCRAGNWYPLPAIDPPYRAER